MKYLSSKGQCSEVKCNRQPLSDSMQRLLHEINEAEQEEFVIKSVPKEGFSVGKICYDTAVCNSQSTSPEIGEESYSDKYFAPALRPCSSEEVFENNTSRNSPWMKMIYSSDDENDNVFTGSKKSHDSKRRSSLNSDLQPQVVASSAFAGVCSEISTHDVHLATHISEVDGVLQRNLPGPSSRFSKGLNGFPPYSNAEVKVAAAVEIMNEIQLKPVIESKEDSTVELAEELAEISFDAAHVSTPLQRVLKSIGKDAKRVRSSKAENKEAGETNTHKVALRKDESVQTFATSRKFSDAVKLGEGSFGEVFKCFLDRQEVALKVNMAPEVIVSDMLQSLCIPGINATNGFIKFPGAFVVKGRYPTPLLKAWDNYDGESINDCPREFSRIQKFVLLAYDIGGRDLEKFKPKSVSQAYSVVYQIAYALAVAEEVLEFEHRDLHCGNILVADCVDEFREEVLSGDLVKIRTYGVSVKLIDFSLSRLRKGYYVVILSRCMLASCAIIFFTLIGDYNFTTLVEFVLS
ncbi:unnamed protein product [Enterobius vermicularis]|uniref:Protein kinase domain-containing protein n=1 Tax=Enterobius vermicularis TaxID=51028 RepID=A0A0N4VDY1_ENTVE|nr:unnamed protein product [Enterobius vermicularis]